MPIKPGRNLGGPASDRNLNTQTGRGAKTGIGATWDPKGQSRGLGGTHKSPFPEHLDDRASKYPKKKASGRAQADADEDYK